MSEHLKLTVFAIYISGAILAYGHAWSHVQPLGESNSDHALNRFLLTASSAVLWPLYLSTVVFEKEKS